MSDRELMQQALEALDAYSWEQVQSATVALRERLAQPEQEQEQEQEPPCKTGASCVGGKCPQCEAQQPYASHAAYLESATNFRLRVDPVTGAVGIGSVSPPEFDAAMQSAGCAQTEVKQGTHWDGCEEVHPECRKQEQEPDGIGWIKREGGYFDAPRREWVGLTEAEKVNVAIACGCADVAWMDFADAIEANLREKNS